MTSLRLVSGVRLIKTKTMIVSMSRTMCPQSPALTLDGTVLEQSDDLVILGVKFESKMTLRSIFALSPEQLLEGLACGSPGK